MTMLSDHLVYGFVYGILILSVIVVGILVGLDIDEYIQFENYCAKEKGGEVIQEHCVYVEQGTSQSFSMDKWKKQNECKK